MAGKYTGLQKAYSIYTENINPDTGKNEIPMYRGVVLASEHSCMLPLSDNMTPLGVVANDERLDDPIRAGGSQANRNIAVQLSGITEIEMDTNVSAGDRVILGAGGKGKALPAEPGTYEVLGFAEKQGVRGDVVPVRMAYHVYTVA